MTNHLISSAQNREDLYLFALLGDVKKGFYIDVGANHAELHSVTKLFYDKGWSGMNIEPNPVLHKELVNKRRRDINLNIGVSDHKGDLKFRNYPHHDGLSTFSEMIMKLHEKEGLPFEDQVVPVTTLAMIFRQNKIKKIDFMKIDVEGYEIEVINGNNWEKYRPKVIVVEATVRHKLNPLMKKLDYRLEFFDGLNNYYVDDRLTHTITIHNFAGRVLGVGNYTAREYSALKELELVKGSLEDISLQLDRASKRLINGGALRNNIRIVLNRASRYTNRRPVKGN